MPVISLESDQSDQNAPSKLISNHCVGLFFDLCAMSKFVHYAKYPHELAIMNERLHYWGHFFM